MPGNSTSRKALALSQENRRCRSCQGQISRMALPRCLSCWRQLIAGERPDPAVLRSGGADAGKEIGNLALDVLRSRRQALGPSDQVADGVEIAAAGLFNGRHILAGAAGIG